MLDADNTCVKLNNGLEMPIIGLGTFQFENDADRVTTALKTALETGYRHIDTAYLYRNETVIGEVVNEVLAEGKFTREDLFIVTKKLYSGPITWVATDFVKTRTFEVFPCCILLRFDVVCSLPVNGMRPQHVQHFLELSLKNLNLKYVDLYLIHMPIGFQYVSDDNTFPTENEFAKMDNSTDLVKIWQKMEEMVDLGLAKSIGVSNFSWEQLDRILNICRIKPVANQVECHAYLQQKKLHDFCKKYDIALVAYAPLGSPGLIEFMETAQGLKLELPVLLDDPVVKSISEKYKKAPSQVLLRWQIQRGVVVIPKSVKPSRIKENFDIFDFKLGPEDVTAIDALDKNVRMYSLCWMKGMEVHPEYKKWMEHQ